MDDLPIEFPAKTNDTKIDHINAKTAISALVHDIWKVGGFRFAYNDVKSGRYRYFCNQDKNPFQKYRGNGVRDVHQMDRFDCQSLLGLYPCFKTRTLRINLKHHYHSPYIDKSITPEMAKFIKLHAAEKTPTNILKEAQSTDVPGSKILTIGQVHNLKKKLKSQLLSNPIGESLIPTTLISSTDQK